MQESSRKAARLAAQQAYAFALETVEDDGVTPPEHQFLWRQRPVSIDQEGRIVLLVGSLGDLATTRGHPAISRVARALRTRGLSTGFDYQIKPCPPRTLADATHTLPAAPPGRQVILYLPQFLTCHTLPHRKVAGAEFSRRNGKTRLTLLAPSDTGLPYGTYPRLILIHLATCAVRTGRRDLVLGKTVNDFLRKMGVGNDGGKKRASTRARDQIDRLCQTTFKSKSWDGRKEGASIPLFDSFAELTPDRLTIVLGERFYKLTRELAVPLDGAIVRELRRSPLALDMYCWLTSRVTTLKRETLVPWASLAGQFGAAYG